ncbi:MAG: CapA family protein [Bacilli bacterium]
MAKTKKKKIIYGILIFSLLLITSVFLFFLMNKKEEPKKEKPEEPKKPLVENFSFNFIGAGDALIHNGVYNDAATGTVDANGYQQYNFNKMFPDIKEIIEPYDLKYYNQETVIGGKALGLSNYPNFNSPDEIGTNLTDDIGFNMVSLASNHTMDKGIVGAEYSTEFWSKKPNVYKTGSYRSFEERNNTEIRTINGISYAMLNYTYGLNGNPFPTGKDYLVNLWPVSSDAEFEAYKVQVKKDVDAIRNKVDVLMVAMHWGNEYVHTPNTYQRNAAEYLASLGVNVIVGAHPHVIQPIEYIGDTLVIYSLGNLISAQDGTIKRVGMLASFTAKKETTNGKTTKIEITDAKADLIWTHYNYYRNFKIMPFTKLTDATLYNYRGIYDEYLKHINPKNDPKIQVGFIK